MVGLGEVRRAKLPSTFDSQQALKFVRPRRLGCPRQKKSLHASEGITLEYDTLDLAVRRPADTKRVVGKEKRPLRFRGFKVDSGERQQLHVEALREPELARAIVGKTFQLYRRYPLLFLVLALGVIAPYDLLVLIATGSGPLAKSNGFGVNYLLAVFLVSPLISALHIHAVAEAQAGRAPRLSNIAARGLRVLPSAAATAIMTTLGIAVGLVLLIVPGVILAFRWYVAVQAAAIEHEGWFPAMRRSRELTAGVYGHLFAFGILIAIIGQVPLVIARAGVTGHDTLAAAFIGGVLLHAFAAAFTALATALLYFDLASRHRSVSPQAPRDYGVTSAGDSAHTA